MKTAFLILGAQRSGTSVTSHVLSRFGIDLGDEKDFLQADHNPIFFELNWVIQLNDNLINALGHNYTDYFLPLEKDFKTLDILKLEQKLQFCIQQEWGEKSPIGIKDPRFSITFPVWEKVLTKTHQLNIIFAFRNPAGFLKSNRSLFSKWNDWDDARHLDFWLQMNLSAVYFTRHFQIYYLNYDHLMQNPLAEVSKLANFFNLDRSLETYAAAAVDRSYYHHEELYETGFSFVDQCYQLLCSQTLTPIDYLSYRQNGLLNQDEPLKLAR